MRRKILEIKYSRQHRVNDHDIDRYSLYVNGREVYAAQYKSCVVNFINENYAKSKNARLRKKLGRLQDKRDKLYKQINAIQDELAKPLINIEGRFR
jgi:hypothetical protein